MPDQLYQELYDRVYSKLFQHIGSFEQALPLPIAVPAWGLLEIGVLPSSRFVKFWIHLVEGCRRYNVYTILEIMKYWRYYGIVQHFPTIHIIGDLIHVQICSIMESCPSIRWNLSWPSVIWVDIQVLHHNSRCCSLWLVAWWCTKHSHNPTTFSSKCQAFSNWRNLFGGSGLGACCMRFIVSWY